MFYKQQMCRNCGKKGHIAKVCRGEKVALHGTSRPNAPSQGNKPKFRNRPHRTNYVDCQSDSSDDDCSANTPQYCMFLQAPLVYLVFKSQMEVPILQIVLKPKVNGSTIEMELIPFFLSQ